MPEATCEIFCKEVEVVTVTRKIFDYLYPYYLTKMECPYCKKHLQYIFHGTKQRLIELIERKFKK